jgi:hypothetical protein
MPAVVAVEIGDDIPLSPRQPLVAGGGGARLGQFQVVDPVVVEPGNNAFGVVRACIVANEQLPVSIVLLDNAPDGVVDLVGPVVCRHDDADQRTPVVAQHPRGGTFERRLARHQRLADADGGIGLEEREQLASENAAAGCGRQDGLRVGPPMRRGGHLARVRPGFNRFIGRNCHRLRPAKPLHRRLDDQRRYLGRLAQARGKLRVYLPVSLGHPLTGVNLAFRNLPPADVLKLASVSRPILPDADKAARKPVEIADITQPSASMNADAIGHGALIEGHHRNAAGPKLGERVAEGLRPDREDAADMGLYLLDPIPELVAAIAAMKHHIGGCLDGRIDGSQNVDFELELRGQPAELGHDLESLGRQYVAGNQQAQGFIVSP